MSVYRVLIADDHHLARLAVRSLLEDDSDFLIVGEASGGAEAVRLCEHYRPDVVLTDIRMPDMSGLEVTRLIKQRQPETKVVILSVSDSVQDLFTAIQYGAQGYLLKDMDPGDWLTYLRALLADEADAARGMADKLFHRFRSGADGGGAASVGETSEQMGRDTVRLTVREREIAIYVAKGVKNRQIASQLSISEYTVKNHVKNILQKLSMDNRVQLTAYVIRMGWE